LLEKTARKLGSSRKNRIDLGPVLDYGVLFRGNRDLKVRRVLKVRKVRRVPVLLDLAHLEDLEDPEDLSHLS
jgi:hypothetical protein